MNSKVSSHVTTTTVKSLSTGTNLLRFCLRFEIETLVLPNAKSSFRYGDNFCNTRVARTTEACQSSSTPRRAFSMKSCCANGALPRCPACKVSSLLDSPRVVGTGKGGEQWDGLAVSVMSDTVRQDIFKQNALPTPVLKCH